MEFCAIKDEYIVLRLKLADFKMAPRPLDEDCRIGGAEDRTAHRDSEREILGACFEDWDVPYYGRLKGWRADSPVYIFCKGKLVGGVYLCGRSEFGPEPGWGQLHYAFVQPSHRGEGLYSALFWHAVAKAKDWGLTGLILNTDRHGLSEMYTRLGGRPWKRISKRNKRIRRCVSRVFCLAAMSALALEFSCRLGVPPNEAARIDAMIRAQSGNNSTRILILGDSFSRDSLAPGDDAPPEKTAMRLLGDHLSDKSTSILNLAQGGMGPLDYSERLRLHGIRFAPDLIMVNYYVGNDLTDTQYRSRPARRYKDWVMKSYLGRHLMELRSRRIARRRLRAVRRIIRDNPELANIRNPFFIETAKTHPGLIMDNLRMEKPQSRQAWEINKAILLGIRDTAKAMGARLLVNVFPSPLQVNQSQYQFHQRLGFVVDEGLLTETKPQDLMGQFCLENDIQCHDLLPGFRSHSSREYYLENDGHWNGEGNRLAFQLVKEKLETSRILTPPF